MIFDYDRDCSDEAGEPIKRAGVSTPRLQTMRIGELMQIPNFGYDSPLASAFATFVLAGLLLVSAPSALLAGCSRGEGEAAASVNNADLLRLSDENDAFGESYRVALKKVSDTAPDAKLLGVQTLAPVVPGAAPYWTYLFGSMQSAETYTVFLQVEADSEDQPALDATVAGYGPLELTQEEWDALPSFDDVAIASMVGSGKALRTAEHAFAEEIGNYSAYLLSYVSPESESSIEPMRWEIVLQDSAHENEGGGQGEAVEQDGGGKGSCFVVDAFDGALWEKTE